MLNFNLVREKKSTYKQLAANLTVKQLHKLTDESIDLILKITKDARDRDVVFQPADPKANDTFATNTGEVGMAWTLGHVIVHQTASAEEAAMLACELARGVVVEKRSRYETQWETVKTIKQCRQRLEDSRSMRHALLNAWPVKPLGTTYTPGAWAGEVDCKARFIMGLGHEESHYQQLREIMQQAIAAKPQAKPAVKKTAKKVAKKPAAKKRA